MHLVPVTINYERVFEMGNLALEMVSGEIPEESTLGLFQRIQRESGGKLGRASVIFGNSLDLKDWIKSVCRGPLTS